MSKVINLTVAKLQKIRSDAFKDVQRKAKELESRVIRIYFEYESALQDLYYVQDVYYNEILTHKLYKPISELKDALYDKHAYKYIPFIFKLVYKYKGKSNIQVITSVSNRAYKLEKGKIEIEDIMTGFKYYEKQMLGYFDLYFIDNEGNEYEYEPEK